jgi:hypothetical protein
MRWTLLCVSVPDVHLIAFSKRGRETLCNPCTDVLDVFVLPLLLFSLCCHGVCVLVTDIIRFLFKNIALAGHYILASGVWC